MPPLLTRADTLREFLTGALTSGGLQTNPLLSLGGYASSTEAASYGITVVGQPPGNAQILYAGGGNPPGNGFLTAPDTNNLTWQPPGASSPGAPVFFPSYVNSTLVVEGATPGQYLRINAFAPFIPHSTPIILATLVDNVFSFDDVSIAQATAGENEYLATIVANWGAGQVSSFQRWTALLGTPQTSNSGWLGDSGAGTISTGGNFNDWPVVGWCLVQAAGGSLAKEIVYYSSRTATMLTIPAAGRGLLGSTAQAGQPTDTVLPVPGTVLGIDPAGIQPYTSPIQTIPDINTSPSGVVWLRGGVTAGLGLQIGTLLPNQAVGIWTWRQIPPGAVSSPLSLIQYKDSFNAF